MDCACPKCGSDNTQSLKVLCESGTSRGRSVGTGTSFSRGTGLGTHNTFTKTTIQSDLAKKFSPGAKPGEGAGFLVSAGVFGSFALLSFALGKTGVGGMTIFWLVLAAIMAFIYLGGRNPRREELKSWQQRVAYADSAWFCHRCGADWIPQ